jgi:hypothetical protein
LPYSDDVRMRVYEAIYKMVSDYDSQHQQTFFDQFPDLDYHDDSGDATLQAAVAGLVATCFRYMNVYHFALALMANTYLWLQLRGFPISRRLATELKWSKLNTTMMILQGMPYNQDIYNYIVSQQRILVFDNVVGGVGLALPMYLQAQDTRVEYPSGPYTATTPAFESVLGDASNGERTLDYVNDGIVSKRFPSLSELHENSPIWGFAGSGSEVPSTDWAGNEYTTSFQYGALASYMWRRLTTIVDTIQTSFSDALRTDHPLNAFLRDFFGCSGTFDAAALSTAVREMEPLDGRQFVSDYMTVFSKPHPVLYPYGYQNNWDLNVWNVTDREDQGYMLTPSARVPYHLNDGFVGIVNGVGLADFRDVSIWGGAINLWDVLREGGTSWGVAYPQTDDVIELASTWGKAVTTSGNYSPFNGFGLLAMIYQRYLNGTYEFFKDMEGFIPTYDQVANEGFAPYINPLVYRMNGTLAIKTALRPSINVNDVHQCGFFAVLQYDEDTPWSLFMKSDLHERFDSALSTTGTLGLWEEDSALYKDMLLWIGDAIFMHPDEFFARTDLGIYQSYPGTAAVPREGMIDGFFPSRPFDATGMFRQFMRDTKLTTAQHVTALSGVVWDATDKTYFIEDTDDPYALAAITFDTYPQQQVGWLYPHRSRSPIYCFPLKHNALINILLSNYEKLFPPSGEVQLPSVATISGKPADVSSAVRQVLDLKTLTNLRRRENVQRPNSNSARGRDRRSSRGNKRGSGGSGRSGNDTRSNRDNSGKPDFYKKPSGNGGVDSDKKSEYFKPDERSEEVK